MAEAAKRTECVKVCFEEKLFIDLNRIVILQDRKLSDLIYILSRKYAYGHVTPTVLGDEGPQEASDAP